jgi:hypothetical protein
VTLLVQVTVFLIGAYAKYNWPYVWVSDYWSCNSIQQPLDVSKQLRSCFRLRALLSSTCAASNRMTPALQPRPIHWCSSNWARTNRADSTEDQATCHTDAVVQCCLQLRSFNRNGRGTDIDAPLDLPSTNQWQDKGEKAAAAVLQQRTDACSRSCGMWIAASCEPYAEMRAVAHHRADFQ